MNLFLGFAARWSVWPTDERPGPKFPVREDVPPDLSLPSKVSRTAGHQFPMAKSLVGGYHGAEATCMLLVMSRRPPDYPEGESLCLGFLANQADGRRQLL